MAEALAILAAAVRPSCTTAPQADQLPAAVGQAEPVPQLARGRAAAIADDQDTRTAQAVSLGAAPAASHSTDQAQAMPTAAPERPAGTPKVARCHQGSPQALRARQGVRHGPGGARLPAARPAGGAGRPRPGDGGRPPPATHRGFYTGGPATHRGFCTPDPPAMQSPRYRWQTRWQLDQAAGIATHDSGLIVRFTGRHAEAVNGDDIQAALAVKNGPHNAPIMLRRLLKEAAELQAKAADHVSR